MKEKAEQGRSGEGKVRCKGTSDWGLDRGQGLLEIEAEKVVCGPSVESQFAHHVSLFLLSALGRH